MISILIADDHAILREGLRKVLSFEDDFKVIGEAENGEEAIEKTLKLKPDILLLDINMPKKNGLEVAKELDKQKLSTKIIALTIQMSDNYVMAILKYGVLGYILKDVEPEVLIRAIRAVYNGNTYVYPEIAERIGNFNENEFTKKSKFLYKKHHPGSLTTREMDVLSCIGKGLNNQEIAEKLSVSEKTVKNHLTNIFKKLKVTDRTQALVCALKDKILTID